LANEKTPEERLKKYKERLAKMAQDEGRDIKLDSQYDEEEKEIVKWEPPSPDSASKEVPIEAKPSPPRTLESPAKKELRESQVVKKRREKLVKRLGSSSGKNRIMLKARQKAIDNQLREIKNDKELLELQFKRKVIDRTEYEQRMDLLVKEGHELLKEKAEIDKSLAKK
jgi:hypothetical protein